MENGNITDNIKKGEIEEILHKVIERMNNELYITVRYELEGCGAQAEPVLGKGGRLELMA